VSPSPSPSSSPLPIPLPDERTRALIAASGALFLSVLVWFNYSAVLPVIVEEWGLSGLRAGIVFGAFQAGYLTTILPAGWLADRRSPRLVVSVGAVGAGGWSLAFAALAGGFASGTLLRFLSGAFIAGVYVPGMRFVSDWFPPADRGRAMGLYVGTFSLASGLSFVVSTAVAGAVDWRAAVAVTSVGALLAPALMLGLATDSPARVARERDAPDADEDAGTDADEDADADADASRIDLSVLGNRRYRYAVSVYAWHNWELFGMRNWLLAFLLVTPAIGALDASATAAGLLVGAVVAMSAPGNVLGGYASDRIGRTTAVGLGLAASGLISLSLGWLGRLAVPLPALVAILLGYGVVISVDSAPTSTLVTEVVDDDRVGAALSLQSFVGFVPAVVSPAVFGLALDYGGYRLAFPTLAAGAAAGLASVLVLRRLGVGDVGG